MKQIVDKLNKIAKAIDSDVTISNRKLIIDSLDSITKAFGGTPNNSKLIVDKLDDIANYVHGGGGFGGCTITFTNNTNMIMNLQGINSHAQFTDTQIQPNESITLNYYYVEYEYGVWCAAFSPITEGIVTVPNTDVITDMINCTSLLVESEGYYLIQATNPEKASSCSVSMTGAGPV